MSTKTDEKSGCLKKAANAVLLIALIFCALLKIWTTVLGKLTTVVQKDRLKLSDFHAHPLDDTDFSSSASVIHHTDLYGNTGKVMFEWNLTLMMQAFDPKHYTTLTLAFMGDSYIGSIIPFVWYDRYQDACLRKKSDKEPSPCKTIILLACVFPNATACWQTMDCVDCVVLNDSQLHNLYEITFHTYTSLKANTLTLLQRYNQSYHESIGKIWVQRIFILSYLLSHTKYDVFMTDLDAMWMKNPLKYFDNHFKSSFGYFDILGGRAQFPWNCHGKVPSKAKQTLRPHDKIVMGFIYIRNTENTKLLLLMASEEIANFEGYHRDDQIAFNCVLFQDYIVSAATTFQANKRDTAMYTRILPEYDTNHTNIAKIERRVDVLLADEETIKRPRCIQMHVNATAFYEDAKSLVLHCQVNGQNRKELYMGRLKFLNRTVVNIKLAQNKARR